MPQMAPMLWMFWMVLFWIITLAFMLINYFTGSSLVKSAQSQPKLSLKFNHESKLAGIMNKLLNE